MSKCPNCGGELTYDVGATSVVCPYCKSKFNPQELNTKTKFSKERDTFEGKSYNCKQCGATLLTFDETAITFCSYCGSQNVIESKMVKVNNPDFVIPFSITKEECIARYKKFIKKALFVPKYMKEEMTVEKFRGIFMPYGVYKTAFNGKSRNVGERYSHRSGDYIIYNKYAIDAMVDVEYDGISFDLLSKFYDSYSLSIPFDYSGVVPFNKNYLMGFYADMKDVDSEVYDNMVKRITSSDTSSYLKKHGEYFEYGCYKPVVALDVSECKTGMFPIYFLAIKDKKGQLHYAIINGQTGKIAADLPIDFKKFIFGTLLLGIAIFALLYFGTVVLPKTILIFSLIASVISIIVAINQSIKIFDKENHLSDKGYISKFDTEYEIIEKEKVIESKNGGTVTTVKKNVVKPGKRPEKVNFKYIYKQILGIIIGIGVMASGTFRDEYYYGAAIIIFLLIVISFKDLVKEHNLLSSNKPPQLEKRGGDEK